MSKNRTNRWIVVIPVVLVACLTGLVSLLLIGFETGLLGFLIGFVMAAVPVPFYVAFILWIDRFEPEPAWLLGLAFIWGAAIATFFSLISNTINSAIFAALAGAAAGETLGAVLSAPFVEELAKGVALLLLFLWQRDEFDNVTDGIVYATMVGLGFAMTENIAYYGRAVADQNVGAVGVFVVRGMMGPFAHPLFTSMTGIGLGLARESDRKGARWIAPIAGICGAMFLHFLWNLSASFGAMFFVAYFIVMVPAFFALLIVMVLSLRREARIIRLHLEQIAGEGVVSSDDVAALCSATGRITSTWRALATGGFSAWNATRRFHRLATEFAFHSWRVSRGVSEADSAFRNDLLRDIREARRAAGLTPVAEPPSREVIRRYTMEVRVPDVALADSYGTLLMTAGPLSGRSFPIIPGGVSIGRDPSLSQLVVGDPRVSKKHAWVGYRDGSIVVVDRGSTNGTFVNGQRVRQTTVASGDRIALADAVAFEIRA